MWRRYIGIGEEYINILSKKLEEIMIMWRRWKQELKEVSQLAAGMVCVAILQGLTPVMVMTMAKHLGQLRLSAVAIAHPITDVTGFSLVIGLCGGLETLCGQAHGAKQYQKLRTYTYSCMISILPICIPISLTWIFLDKILVLAGQDPLVAVEARDFSLVRIPGLIAAAFYFSLARFLQCQSLSLPLLLCNSMSLVFNTFTCWFLAFKMELGVKGLALSMSLGNCLNAVFLCLYIIWSSSCDKTRAPFTKDAFFCVPEFLRFAFPAALMVCVKWWAFELLMLIAHGLPNSQLETSVLSICLNMSTLHLAIPYGLGVAVSVRVANQLGAGNPKSARITAWVVTLLGVGEAVVTSAILFGCRYIVGYAYRRDNKVVSYVSRMVPFLCLSIITDGLLMVLSGVAKGSGWQHIGAYVNVGAFYLVGFPLALVLGFVGHLRAKGFWLGILVGSTLQSIFFIIVTARANWQTKAIKAKERASTPPIYQQRVDNNALVVA